MLLEAFLETAARRAEKPAVEDVRRTMTYRELMVASAAMKRLIDKATVRPNVGLLLPSTAGFVAGFFGGLWAGRTVVPLNFLLQPDELRAVVEDAGLDLVLTCEYFEGLVRQLPVRAIVLERAGLRRRFLASRFLPVPKVPKTLPDDLAILLYTSGTSGAPKGVCLSNRNLCVDARACIEHMRMSPDHRFLGVLPLFHAFGLTATMVVPMLLGATVVYQPRFQPPDVVRAIAEKNISVFMAAASMFSAIGRVKNASPEHFRNLYLAISGGEPLSPVTHREFLDRFHVNILEGYGLTETSPVVSANVPWANRPGKVGLPIPGIEVVAKDDDGRPVPVGVQGEICVRGPIVMRGYYNRREETAAAFDADGFLRTGDLGTIDPDGFLAITGRKKDLIIVAGENVFPREIELVLDRHPAVAQSAVIGVRDPVRGEVVVGFVIPKDGLEVTPLELRAYCRNHLAGFKVPRDIIIDHDLPRSPTGKVAKRLLRDMLAERHGQTKPSGRPY